ncbi:glycerophosphodiester phosphodiesterase [Solicola gregarius]|uniref:Glycerophosphodiester phosphodiesterase n=1 Tax=Solicola gregarius TaxID=2908642 RepID=A0AA46TGY5_9ACTN|nr:glycerophosphodiester phosphodiesterase [Solicola gregarius]UYM05080.1 glycerophosphodiester phosphodiesterase [Solicola gregarius]
MPRFERSTHPYLDWPGPQAIAHRGGAKLQPNLGLENSLLAFRNAVHLGYRYLETDVHASRDGVVFAFHDTDLDRVTDGTGAVAALSAAVVRDARIAGREPIPELTALLAEFPAARFNIDVKADSAVVPTLDVVREHAAFDRVCLASFSDARLARIRRLEPRVATSIGPKDVAALRLGYPFRRRGLQRAICVQVPRRRGRLTIVTPSFVRRAHARGLHVHVWTVDDAATMTALLDLGVDGIVTDRPDTLRDVLVRRGEWVSA